MTTASHPATIYLKHYQVPPFLIDTVELEFQLDEDVTMVTSILVIEANPESHAAKNTLVLQGEALQLEAIHLNGTQLTAAQFKQDACSLTIMNMPKKATLKIQTRLQPQHNTALSGLYKSSGNFCTQCEAQGFRRITYFLDRPDVMSRYTTKLIADTKKYPVLLSNGNLIDSGKLANGKHWVVWQDPYRKPSYLFALVAGDFDWVKDSFKTASGRHVELCIYVEKGHADRVTHAMQAVKKAMRWDEVEYGREYDLDIYMIVAVSDFNMGAMENKGLNIFNTKYILAKPDMATDLDYIHIESVIAHEYFHNWTGNRITCRDWFQLSLKEGLTIFRDQCFTADTTSKTVARILDVNDLRVSQFPEDAGPLAHSVRPESYIEINNFYTSTIYNKGAEVIRMIQTIVGNTLFRKGMELYFSRHDGQAVTIEDFVKAHEDASDTDLKQFQLWYSQAGTPTLIIKDAYDATRQQYRLSITQICPPTPDQPIKLPMHIPLKMGLLDESGNELANKMLEIKHKEQDVIFESIPVKPVPSLLRNFSAPVKIQYEYTDQALALLFKHDTDLFNRWEAGQKFAVNSILRLVKAYQNEKQLVTSIDFLKALQHVLNDVYEDKWLQSEMLTLPSEKYLSEQMTIVDVDAIHVARECVLVDTAAYLKNHFLKLYEENQSIGLPHEFTMSSVGSRYLKNLCLFYVMLLNDSTIHEAIGMRQFTDSLEHNMTDTMAALRSLVNADCPQREMALALFYKKWSHDSLVIDKWLALQASSTLPDTLVQVKTLFKSAAFDLKNPNKVHSLIGVFGNNAYQFHQKSGEGYHFLTEVVLELDKINPQIAARMLKPLTDWKRYDTLRQKLMYEQLEWIKQQKLSPDVFEIVTKSL